MSFIAAAIIGGVGAIGAAGIGAYASMSASKQQQAGLQQAEQLQQGYFNTAQQGLQPYIQGGQSVLPALQSLLTPGPNQNATLSQLPGFQFANYWGQQAARNQGTTMGLGGNTLAAGAQYATGLAQQNFSQYINPLLSYAQLGSGAAGSLAGTAQGFGQQATGAATGIGQAQAAGTLGAANAIGGGLTGAANSYGNYALLNMLTRGNAAAGGQYGPVGQQVLQ